MKGSSKHKTIATRTASASIRTTPIHHTRGRPHKKPRSSSTSLSPSPSLVAAPAPVKRRKPCQKNETRQDDVFAIKDITDEKLINGKRFFRIDWADDPTTGESFAPTWEPAENANGHAIEDWERVKQLRALQSEPSDSQVSQGGVPDGPSDIESSRNGAICIELLSRADFLKSKPEFDTASVIAIPSSQLSDWPHPDSEVDLPPSQFWVVSSQPSQDIVLVDSQPLWTWSSALQQVGGKAYPRGISQTTIPDSQDFLNEVYEDPVEVPGTAEDLDQGQEEAISPRPSNKESSGSTIPSHQPNINQVSFAHELLGIEPECQLVSLQDFQQIPSPPLPPATADAQASLKPLSPRNPLEGFLTQPAFDPGEFSLSAESKLQSATHVATTATYQSADYPSLEDSHQPAQRTSPLAGKTSQFLTQTDADFYSASEDYEVVPESSLRGSGQTRLLQEASLQQPVAESVEDSVFRTTTVQSQHGHSS